jgi:hypothetical protein
VAWAVAEAAERYLSEVERNAVLWRSVLVKRSRRFADC